jgi:ubiquinone/menaquinone biosynthesis C-methylase UbiE
MISAEKNWEPRNLTPEDLADGEAYHRALYPTGSTDVLAGWHEESIIPLVEKAAEFIKTGDIVVDYGSGSGGSAVELLKLLDSQNKNIKLVLIDPLPSWFSKAWDLLHFREDVFFRLSSYTDSDGKYKIRTLEEMLEGEKVDYIISASTLHLIPPKVYSKLFTELYNSLKSEGTFFWNSGDIERDDKPENTVFLHDPYRRVRDLIADDKTYREKIKNMPEKVAKTIETIAARMFPPPPTFNVLKDALTSAGFEGKIDSSVVTMNRDDARSFITVPRLTGIAGAIEEKEEREKLILHNLEISLNEMKERGQANESGYQTFWTYGTFSKTGGLE